MACSAGLEMQSSQNWNEKGKKEEKEVMPCLEEIYTLKKIIISVNI